MGNTQSPEAEVEEQEMPKEQAPEDLPPLDEDEDYGEEMTIPSVAILDSEEGDSLETLATVALPEGIKITGGVKLRDAGYTGIGVKVAVIDSGVDKDHPGFNGKVTKTTWYREGNPLSKDFHGTHVAGTVHLMAPDAEIYDYRVFGRTGQYNVNQAIVVAIDQARIDGCDVINMSLGGPFPNRPMERAIKRAHDAGIIVVCAAGNSGDGNPMTNENSYPANYKECISVAALQKEDGLPVARFSNSNAQVDYAGIGVNVLSLKPGGDVFRLSGTSMASPHVAGLVASILSKEKATDRPDDVIITKPETPGGGGGGGGACCGLFAAPTAPKRVKPLIFQGIKDDASLRKVLNEQFAIDIGVKGPDNSTGLGFLTYLTEDELDDIF